MIEGESKTKNFFMPTVWKLILTAIFVFIYFAYSRMCLLAELLPADPLKPPLGLIYPCGEFLSTLAESVFIPLDNILAWALVIAITYIIFSSILYLINKKR